MAVWGAGHQRLKNHGGGLTMLGCIHSRTFGAAIVGAAIMLIGASVDCSALKIAYAPQSSAATCGSVFFGSILFFGSSKREETVAWTTPVLVEICIGLEINGYMPADGYVPPEF
jgi:coenzyme PQQ precursor peptide PqqA